MYRLKLQTFLEKITGFYLALSACAGHLIRSHTQAQGFLLCPRLKLLIMFPNFHVPHNSLPINHKHDRRFNCYWTVYLESNPSTPCSTCWTVAPHGSTTPRHDREPKTLIELKAKCHACDKPTCCMSKGLLLARCRIMSMSCSCETPLLLSCHNTNRAGLWSSPGPSASGSGLSATRAACRRPYAQSFWPEVRPGRQPD